jgi:hypothetical protein
VINRCNISNNTSNRTSGGVFLAGGSGSISNSTISGNVAGLQGGGIFDSDGLLNLTNDTIDGNTGTLGGGIFYQDGSDAKPLTLNNVTITGNRATSHGGGLFRNTGIVNLKNSIIALNTSDIDFAPDIRAISLNSLGYNLIGIKDSGANYVDGNRRSNRYARKPSRSPCSAHYRTTADRRTHAPCSPAARAIDAGNPAGPVLAATRARPRPESDPASERW